MPVRVTGITLRQVEIRHAVNGDGAGERVSASFDIELNDAHDDVRIEIPIERGTLQQRGTSSFEALVYGELERFFRSACEAAFRRAADQGYRYG